LNFDDEDNLRNLVRILQDNNRLTKRVIDNMNETYGLIQEGLDVLAVILEEDIDQRSDNA